MDQESRKRCSFTQKTDYAADPSKRGRTEHSLLYGKSAPPEPLSVEELLAVPLEIIFREIQQSNATRGKPLLSRAEAQCLLTVSLLAHEIDVLVTTCATLLRRKTVYGEMGEKIGAVDNPYLWPLIPMLYIVHTRTCDSNLVRVQHELDTILTELRQAANMLRNCSEQNWSLSESLIDAMMGTSGELVATEKRRLSDVQDELCKRIDSFVGVTSNAPNHSDTSFSVFEDSTLSIRDFCAEIFQDESLRVQRPFASCNSNVAPNRSKSPLSACSDTSIPHEDVDTPVRKGKRATMYEDDEDEDSTPLSRGRRRDSPHAQVFDSDVPTPQVACNANALDSSAHTAARPLYSASQDDMIQSIMGLSRTPPNMQQSEPSQTQLRRYSLSSAGSGRHHSQRDQHGTSPSQTDQQSKIPSQSSQDGKENTPSQSLDLYENNRHHDSTILVGGNYKSTGETQQAAYVLTGIAMSSTAQSEADSASQNTF